MESCDGNIEKFKHTEPWDGFHGLARLTKENGLGLVRLMQCWVRLIVPLSQKKTFRHRKFLRFKIDRCFDRHLWPWISVASERLLSQMPVEKMRIFWCVHDLKRRIKAGGCEIRKVVNLENTWPNKHIPAWMNWPRDNDAHWNIYELNSVGYTYEKWTQKQKKDHVSSWKLKDSLAPVWCEAGRRLKIVM